MKPNDLVFKLDHSAHTLSGVRIPHNPANRLVQVKDEGCSGIDDAYCQNTAVHLQLLLLEAGL